jgi:chloramphenicol-sensitive protein RarD
MSVLGMLQYMSPSLQMLLGVWVFHEAFSYARLLGFLFIWGALAIYMAEGWLVGRKATAA